MSVPTRAEAKAQAKALRRELARRGTEIGHAEALELVAQQHGARDWNTLHARLSDAGEAGPAEPFRLGQRVRGRYLGQAFRGEITAIARAGSGRHRVTVRFDAPVDVVRFDSFSALRRQVNALVGADGRSPSRTSDGVPHLVLEPEDAA